MKIRGKRIIPFIVACWLQVIALGVWGQSGGVGASSGLQLRAPDWSTGSFSPGVAWAAPRVAPSRLEAQDPQGELNARLAMARASDHLVSADFYAQHMGFFCKKEWQLEKSSGVPLRFRLGSVDYCDFMEGKTLHLPQP